MSANPTAPGAAALFARLCLWPVRRINMSALLTYLHHFLTHAVLNRAHAALQRSSFQFRHGPLNALTTDLPTVVLMWIHRCLKGAVCVAARHLSHPTVPSAFVVSGAIFFQRPQIHSRHIHPSLPSWMHSGKFIGEAILHAWLYLKYLRPVTVKDDYAVPFEAVPLLWLSGHSEQPSFNLFLHSPHLRTYSSLSLFNSCPFHCPSLFFDVLATPPAHATRIRYYFHTPRYLSTPEVGPLRTTTVPCLSTNSCHQLLQEVGSLKLRAKGTVQCAAYMIRELPGKVFTIALCDSYRAHAPPRRIHHSYWQKISASAAQVAANFEIQVRHCSNRTLLGTAYIWYNTWPDELRKIFFKKRYSRQRPESTKIAFDGTPMFKYIWWHEIQQGGRRWDMSRRQGGYLLPTPVKDPSNATLEHGQYQANDLQCIENYGKM
ncbi:hypothetical protein B0H13DRAFT_2284254 [Mycena leptocephala]|nr:hypothetical protein B0H13DRAFT_2284254 [Mycena leptocephala]